MTNPSSGNAKARQHATRRGSGKAEPAPAVAAKRQSLAGYASKRDFARTPEPGVETAASPDAAAGAQSVAASAGAGALAFVIQKHAASRLHYDFRLEWGGVLLSWAVPKGPSFDPKDKRMAVRTEDHPLAYATFEGTIPQKQYGAGEVIVWDRGAWQPVGDPDQGLREGKLVFDLDGDKLAGRWELVRIQKPGDGQQPPRSLRSLPPGDRKGPFVALGARPASGRPSARPEPWLLFKKRDAWAQPLAAYDVVRALPDSVIAHPLGRLMQRSGAKAALASSDAAAVDVAAAVAAAPAAPLPARLKPQLATLAAAPAAIRGDGWLYEIKFDGYRVLARIDNGKATLFTRQGHDWTSKMKSLAAQFESLGIGSGFLDGELVVQGDDGTPSFNALQNAFDGKATEKIICFLFDVPYLDGRDLRALPLSTRRAILASRLAAHAGERLRLSSAFEGDAASVLESACRMRLEGIVAKRAASPYVSARTETWLKLKCQRRERFTIGGFADRGAAVGEVGSLVLGVREAGQAGLRWIGNVGTGWDARTAAALHAKLAGLQRKASPFDPAHAPELGRWSRREAGGERWVEPALEADVSFSEWTPDGHLRHPVFVALHDPTQRKASAGAAAPAATATAITNPKRVIDASTGLTKLDLVRYYESVAERILPHLVGRPVSLVRGPNGVAGTLFFQKHGEKIGIPGIVELDAKLWPDHQALLEVNNAEALIGCAQMNVIEFHTWNSTAKRIDAPDRIVFDLDPGEGVSWPQVQEGATLVRALLDELGLASFLKTSGGKGLHIVVPITPKLGYDAVKAFSQRAVQHLAKTIPSRFVDKSGPSRRVGRIFVDYLRNGHGATTATAFSARARPGLGVSMPVAWDDLSKLKGGAQWTIATAREHLSFETADPWAAYASTRQGIARAGKLLSGP